MTNRAILSVVAFVLAGVGVVRAEFVPGHVFVSEWAREHCTRPFDADRIWKIDPATGEVSLFAHLIDEWCGGASSIIFTPDGTRLRIAQWDKSRIIELDADANPTILYDNPRHGINAPFLGCMAFDGENNFYVSVFRKILRFAPGSSVAEVFADSQTDPLVGDSSAITIDSAGDLYYVHPGGGGPLPKLVRFTGPHNGSFFYQFTHGNISALQSDSCGHIFAGVHHAGLSGLSQVLRFASGNSDTMEILAQGRETIGEDPYIALDPTQNILYVSTSRTRIGKLSLLDGSITHLAEIPSTGNSGVAVVPVQNPPYGFTPCRPPIPTVTSWGMVHLALILLIAAKVSMGESIHA